MEVVNSIRPCWPRVPGQDLKMCMFDVACDVRKQSYSLKILCEIKYYLKKS